MAKKELFLRRTRELVTEMKIPVIDESLSTNITVNDARCTMVVTLDFEDDERVIKGFLALAQYFHTVVIKRKDKFLIPVDSILFILQ